MGLGFYSTIGIYIGLSIIALFRAIVRPKIVSNFVYSDCSNKIVCHVVMEFVWDV